MAEEEVVVSDDPSSPYYVAEDSEINHLGAKRCKSKRTNGLRCKGSAMFGSNVCYFHGGAASLSKGAQTRQRVMVGTEHLLNAYGGPVVVDPVSGLLQEVYRTNGHILWLQERLLTESPEALVDQLWRHAYGNATNVYRAPNQTETDEHFPKAYQAVWMELYHKERAHFIKACTAAVGANAADRFARLMDAQGQLIGLAIGRILQALELTADQMEKARETVPRELRALVSGEVVE
jgi:hypothetical protein